ncbi:twin-arginine translocation signal domain-containing protein [Candidatus Woesearchaeota archaeon]|jgi:hypothetical protein|nr:twin-arginine translocation signal domain-containing protein [Candidatus Woesearchaeota archaeon]
MTNNSRRKFIKQILAGTVAVATSGVTSKVFAEVYDDGPTKKEKLAHVIECLKNIDNYDLRITKYASKQLPIGFIAKLDVDFVDVITNKSCDISFGVNTNEYSSSYFPHAILSGGEIYIDGEVCAKYQDEFVKLRDFYVAEHIADLRKNVAENRFGLDSEVKDTVFSCTKDYLSLYTKKKIGNYYFRLIYTLLDTNGDGTPDELIIRQRPEYGKDSKVILHTLRDPNFLGTKSNPGLYDGLFKEVYDHLQRETNIGKSVPSDKALEKELENTLDKALEDTMMKMR